MINLENKEDYIKTSKEILGNDKGKTADISLKQGKNTGGTQHYRSALPSKEWEIGLPCSE